MTTRDASGGIDDFLRQMEPRAVGADAYAFEDAARGPRLFGGITLAQALVAAAQTAPGLMPHALHTLFLRPHVPGDAVRYAVERIRDGRRFSTRRVRALSPDRLLSETMVSFTAGGDGLTYQAAAPHAPAPDGLPVFAPSAPPAELRVSRRPGSLFEQRLVQWIGPGEDGRNVLAAWTRVTGDIPADSLWRAAALAALSDLSTQLMGIDPEADPRPASASLNHTLWLHEVPPLDGWLLVVRESTRAVGGRVLMTGEMYTPDGVRCASLAQESLVAEE